MVQHRDADPDHNEGKGSHGIRSWSDVVDEAERASLGSSVPVSIVVRQTAGQRPGFYSSLGTGVWDFLGTSFHETGWLAGLDVTQNGTDEFDISSGFVSIRSVREPVPCGPFIGEAPANIATEEFTIPAINAAGDLVKFNRQLTAAELDTHAQLQTVLHIDNATVTDIDSFRFLAEHITKGTADYVIENGPLNRGNNYTPAADNLTVKKSVGFTVRLMLEGAVSTAASGRQTNDAENPVTLVRSIRDGDGDFILVPTLNVPVGFWDNNTGALLATPRFVIYQFRFFNGLTGCIVGQSTYDTLADGVAAVFFENPDIPATITAQRNNLRTALVAKGDVPDLAAGVIAGTVEFIHVSPEFAGGMVELGSL